MSSTIRPTLDTTFKKDVFEGLTQFPKTLSSKYFYDREGDRLFQEIMDLPEYYLTNCEFEILSHHTEVIASYFDSEAEGFDLIELGAGDGRKTKVLLRYLASHGHDFVYKPIDISQNAIDTLTQDLANELPGVEVVPEKGEYFQVLDRLKSISHRKKIIMVLGSNIGNLPHKRAVEFLRQLREAMNDKDGLFMGFDQKKDPQTILDAYNDPTGVTAAFNKNILTRINRELGGDFPVDKFVHWETYNPESGTAKSYLVSTKAQTVTIEALDLTINFDPWETIHTEISQKYDDKIVEWLAKESGLTISTSFADENKYYKDYLFRKHVES